MMRPVRGDPFACPSIAGLRQTTSHDMQ